MDSSTKEMLDYLKLSEPKDILKDIRDGWEPFPSQLKTIDEIRETHGLCDEVINVLIEYVVIVRGGFKNNDAHAMASYLARNKVASVEQAIELIRNARLKRKQKDAH